MNRLKLFPTIVDIIFDILVHYNLFWQDNLVSWFKCNKNYIENSIDKFPVQIVQIKRDLQEDENSMEKFVLWLI